MSWAAHKDALSDAIDVTFGDALEFRPMSKLTVNDVAGADPLRSIVQVTGVVSRPTQILAIDTRAFTSAAGAGPTLTRPRVSVDLRQFKFGELPRRGDHFKLLDQEGNVYLIEELIPDGQGRVLFTLQYVTSEPSPPTPTHPIVLP